jgi:putative inorganic carbon (HCO3(-)) transporter
MGSDTLRRACRMAQELEWPWLPLPWSVALAAGGVIVTLIILRPQLGLYLLVFSVPFSSPWELRLGITTVGATEALVLLTVASWLARMCVQRDLRLRAGPWSLPLVLFLGAGVLSLLGASSLQHAGKELLKWVEVLGVYLFVVNGLDQSQARTATGAVLLAGGAAALQGAYQFFLQIGPEHFMLFGRFMRAYGTFEQPNPYGGYLGMVWPLALGITISGLWGKDREAISLAGRPWHGAVLRLLAGCIAAFVLAVLVMTWSRGAWLGAVAAMVAMGAALLVRSGARLAVLGSVALLVLGYGLAAMGLSFVPPSIVGRFTDFVPYVETGSLDVRGVEINDANYAVIERLAHWQSAVQMWADHPWLGVGIGNYEVAYPAYQLPGWDEPLGHAHNYYLNIGAEAGALGVLGYLVLWGSVVWQAWRASVTRQGAAWGIGLGVLGVVAHLGMHHLFDNLFVHNMYLHLAALVGLLTHTTATAGEGRR